MAIGKNALAEEAAIEVHSYWQEVHWQEMQQWKGTVISKKHTGGRCNNRSAQLLARSVLAGDVTMEGCSYWQEVHWWEMQ
jgi:hypothetical protein